MVADHFDTLSRGLITPGSRRSVLRTLAALALGGGIATSSDEAQARRCPECKKKKNGRCKNRPNGAFCSVGTCTNGRCGCATINDCYVHGGTGSDGQICLDGKCVCTAPGTVRCRKFDGICGECCSSLTCPGGRVCMREGLFQGPYRCFCNGSVAVECEQVCIPKACAGQCSRSCSGPGADCGCSGYLSCQAEAPGVYHCLPTGKFIT
jgi:hypothetical protein